ncbi:hypothetical protein [Bifidobacterium pseudolongum]|nr:hypothetical protein [Bifidobacterium pseudolongum]
MVPLLQLLGFLNECGEAGAPVAFVGVCAPLPRCAAEPGREQTAQPAQ